MEILQNNYIIGGITLYKSIQIEGKEYKFRITNKSQKEIEKRIGPLMEAIGRAIEAEVMAVIVWGALFPLNSGITLDDADNIIDKMVDEGIIDSAEKRVNFILELLQGAGFFSADQVDKMKKVTV
jgi:hypothetical protein